MSDHRTQTMAPCHLVLSILDQMLHDRPRIRVVCSCLVAGCGMMPTQPCAVGSYVVGYRRLEKSGVPTPPADAV
ncbi:hypothetical protein L6452_18551 [Arctium lappa]|uniref:Uncharacterized protein n=1 Tax=Arctium lappa TaxID=4217 RepID=A0ACB9C6M6_ARCLA|nr:hypothetical protein L6452_18551 [Arctium lappa]